MFFFSGLSFDKWALFAYTSVGFSVSHVTDLVYVICMGFSLCYVQSSVCDAGGDPVTSWSGQKIVRHVFER